VFIAPCDMPLLSTAIFEKLARSPLTRPPLDKKVYLAQTDEKLQPVFLLHRSLHTTIKPALDKGQLRLMQWLKSFDPAIIRFTDTTCFQNFNTREALLST